LGVLVASNHLEPHELDDEDAEEEDDKGAQGGEDGAAAAGRLLFAACAARFAGVRLQVGVHASYSCTAEPTPKLAGLGRGLSQRMGG